MGDRSAIEWVAGGATWNPIRARHKVGDHVGWICVRVSDGCKHCYAATMNGWRGNGEDYTVPGLGRVTPFLDETTLSQPLRWKRPRKIFVCSMTDLFGEWVPDEWIARTFDVMGRCPQHTFLVLTKRAKRMRDYVEADEGRYDAPGGPQRPYPNVHVGASIEDQATADERIPLLLQTPAAVRWVSYEPALGPVDFSRWLTPAAMAGHCLTIDGDWWHEPGMCKETHDCCRPRLDWLVVGGESGPGARPFDLAWARSAISQCRAAGVPVFCKQLGARPILRSVGGVAVDPQGWPSHVPVVLQPGGWYAVTLRDRKGGDWEEWPADLRAREFPDA